MAVGFLCIGAQKARTTWLHEDLIPYPSAWIPPELEGHRASMYSEGLHELHSSSAASVESWLRHAARALSGTPACSA